MDPISCLVCLGVPVDAVESNCDCAVVLCHSCSAKVVRCPTCRKPTAFSPNRSLRRLIGALPASCPNGCDVKVTHADLKEHSLHCTSRKFMCAFDGCHFSGLRTEYMQHLSATHSIPLIKLIHAEGGMSDDASPALHTLSSSAASSSSAGAPSSSTQGFTIPLNALDIVRSEGRSRRLGAPGKYYCGGSLGNVCQRGCCDGNCGLDSGCNCVTCMALDIQARGLPRGWLVNRDGATARKSSTHFYCGRRMRIPNSDGYCGPSNGPNCVACRVLDAQAAPGGAYARFM